MRSSKFTDEQIAFALRQTETGTSVKEVIRKMGISEQTFYRWKKKYSGMMSSDVRRLKQLEEENRQLKKLVADLSLDKQMLQDVLSKKVLKPATKRETIHWLQAHYDISERRGCKVIGFCRGSHRYQGKSDQQVTLRMRIREIALVRV